MRKINKFLVIILILTVFLSTFVQLITTDPQNFPLNHQTPLSVTQVLPFHNLNIQY